MFFCLNWGKEREKKKIVKYQVKINRILKNINGHGHDSEMNGMWKSKSCKMKENSWLVSGEQWGVEMI